MYMTSSLNNPVNYFRRLLSSKAANERNLFDLSLQNQYGKNVLHYLGSDTNKYMIVQYICIKY